MIIEKAIKMLKTKLTILYFTGLIGTLAYIFYPTFFNAPRSDWWESLYFFHSIYQNPSQWVHLLNTDCWGHITFRPLSHVILFLEHMLFGSNFIYVHLINFTLYCCSLVLLYQLALFLGNSIKSTMLFIALFAFLYSHFDIVSWTAHVYSIAAFCAFLLGFILHIKFLTSGKKILLFYTGTLFLLGMFCYEAFILWPLAAVILSSIDDFAGVKVRAGAKKNSLFVVAATYCAYITAFFITRGIGTYADSWDKTGELILELGSIKQILATLYAMSFNVLYNNIFTNILPAVRLPLAFDAVSSNCNLNGLIFNHAPTELAMRAAAIALFLIIAGAMRLARRKDKNIFKQFMLLAFLLLSFTFFLFHFKYYSNKLYHYNFQQFRYQYVPNAMVIMIFLLVINRLRPNRSKKAVYIVLVLLAIANIACILPAIAVEKEQMAPLNSLIFNIKAKLESGSINKNEKIYIDKKLIMLLPRMCWNAEIGDNQMQGTFRWIFDKTQIQSFSDTDKDAAWVIDGITFEVIKKESPDSFKRGGAEDAATDKWFVELPRGMRYLEAGYFYKDKGEEAKTQYIFERALKRGAKNMDLYITLGSIYNKQKKYKEAEDLLKKAAQLNPNEVRVFYELGSCYLQSGKYKKAEKIYKRILSMDSCVNQAAVGLSRVYMAQGRSKETEKIFNWALASAPEDAWLYQEFGDYYVQQKEYAKAEKMYKKSIAADPVFISGHAGLGNLYYAENNYEKAKTIFENLLKLVPQAPAGYRGLGQYYEIKGDLNQSEYCYEQLLKIRPDEAGAMAALGNIYKMQKKYDRAEAMFNKTLTLEPANTSALHGLGCCRYFKNKYDEAEQLFKQALETEPHNANIIADLGHLYIELKRQAEAKELFRKSLAIDPANRAAQAGLDICTKSQEDDGL
ncbi:MAG: tetratricopeptide repeat protein [Candidatus Omnitrophota bacterium]